MVARRSWLRPRPLLVGITWLVAGTWCSSAWASGFDNVMVGSGQSSPVARDAAAVHHNPGQLGYLERTELDVGLGVILGSISYQRDRLGQYQYADNFDFAEPIDPADIDPARTGAAEKVRGIPAGPVIDAFLGIPVVPGRFTLGLGFYVPYAALLSLPDDGPQRYQAQSITLVSTHTTLSAAVKLHDIISIGAGVSYVLSVMQLSKVQDFAAVQPFGDGLAAPPINQPNSFGPQAPSTVRELDLLSRQADIGPAWSHGVSFNAGIALRPTEKLDLALVYQHGSRVRLRGDFMLDMDDDFFTQDLSAQGLEFPPVVKGQAEIELSLPKRITLGAGYRVHPKVSLDGAFSYVFYSDFDVVDIVLSSPDLAQPALGIGERVPQGLVRDWKNTVHAELNVRGQATDKLLVSGTVGYQSGASPDSTIDMASPDGHRLVGGAGIEYAISDRFSILGDLRVQGVIPRTVTASDFDLGNGTYRMLLGLAAVHAKIRFGRKGGRGRKGQEAEGEAAVGTGSESGGAAEGEAAGESGSESGDAAEGEAASPTEPTPDVAAPAPSGSATPPSAGGGAPPPPPPPPG